jgi:4-aminobutyrate aminotransferase-like enzyme
LNLLPEIMPMVSESRFHEKGRVFHFFGQFGGSRGAFARRSFLWDTTCSHEDGVHPPLVTPVEARVERDALDARETKCLERLRALSFETPRPCALVIETLLVSSGLWTYHPIFLIELARVCRELRIVLVADEAVTGGGRTGKLFHFETIPGFCPDVVLFGKMFGVAGMFLTKASTLQPLKVCLFFLQF